jgi:hypothetical protein
VPVKINVAAEVNVILKIDVTMDWLLFEMRPAANIFAIQKISNRIY